MRKREIGRTRGTQGMEGCRRKGSNRRWILTSLKVPRAKSGAGSSGRNEDVRGEKVLSSHPLRRDRGGTKWTSSHVRALRWTPVHYVWEKSISPDIYIQYREELLSLSGRSKTARDDEETRTANPVVAVVSDVVIFSLSHRRGFLFLLFTKVPKSHFADSSAAEGAPTNQLFWWMFTRETLLYAAQPVNVSNREASLRELAIRLS
jgi:hypothetical protein